MRSRTALWFEGKVRFDKLGEDGLSKKVTEQYVLNALSFADAEYNLIEQMAEYISGEYEVIDLKKASYGEVFFSDNTNADKWYKVKIDFIIPDDKLGKEKHKAVYYLVQGGTLNAAMKNIDEAMSRTLADYKSCSVQETKIMDVFELVANVNKTDF